MLQGRVCDRRRGRGAVPVKEAHEAVGGRRTAFGVERGALDPCGAQCRSDRLPPAGPQGQAPAVNPDLPVPTANAFGVAATGWKTYVTVTVKNPGPGAAPQSKLGVAMKLAGVPTPRTLSATNTTVPALAAGGSKTLQVSAQL